MRTVNVTTAKATLPALLDAVADGEEIEITRHGRTIARIVPARGGAALRGKYRGQVWTTDPDDELFSTGVRWDIEDA